MLDAQFYLLQHMVDWRACPFTGIPVSSAAQPHNVVTPVTLVGYICPYLVVLLLMYLDQCTCIAERVQSSKSKPLLLEKNQFVLTR